VDTLRRVTSVAAVLPAANIDTDTIMPKQFLKGIDRSGLAAGLFHDIRFTADGADNPDFALNIPEKQGARILVTGPNFGCGSSREHAVWGLLQFGVRAVLGTTFGNIFSDNAANNGLLLISLDPAQWEKVANYAGDGRSEVTIDLGEQYIGAGDIELGFTIEPDVQRMLMFGLDRIGETLSHAKRIRDFEAVYFREFPWLEQEAPS
jgi:3-isopropylmalate/(R)-2-methylmalate dehydratase small subunit